MHIMGVLTERATDIYLSDAELCEALGYLVTPGRMIRIEAQVPYKKTEKFENAYPGQDFYPMESWANKQSFQLRIMLNTAENCPEFLAEHITVGGGNTGAGCISRGRFVERMVEKFGFQFQTDHQDTRKIRRLVEAQYPTLIDFFDRGYNTPLF